MRDSDIIIIFYMLAFFGACCAGWYAGDLLRAIFRGGW